MTVEAMDFEAFAGKYCERQEQTPQGLWEIFVKQRQNYPDLIGWFMGEAQLLDSSYMGSLVILPYGPSNTCKAPPDHPFSPRGLASDTSVVVATMAVDQLPAEAPPLPPPRPTRPAGGLEPKKKKTWNKKRRKM